MKKKTSKQAPQTDDQVHHRKETVQNYAQNTGVVSKNTQREKQVGKWEDKVSSKLNGRMRTVNT